MSKFIVILLILIFVFLSFFIPGPRGANDYPYTYFEVVKEGFNLPLAWTSRFSGGLGYNTIATLGAWPIDLFYGLGATMNLNFSILERILGILPILVLGLFSISRLFRYFSLTGWGKNIGILFFLLNSYIVQLIDGGQLAIGLAYVWIPISFVTINKSLEGSFRQKVFAALTVVTLGFFDPRFIFILGILLLLHFVYTLLFINKNQWFGWLIRYIQTGVITIFLLIGLNSYWLLPLNLNSDNSFLPPAYTRASQIDFLSFASLGHSLLMQPPHWYMNVFGRVSNLKAEFILIPLLVFLAPILRRKDKIVGFWLLIALVGIFLVKGSQPPLSQVYPWLFTHIPGFSLFRDPTKFYFLIALAYSILLAISIEEICKLSSRYKILNKFVKATPFIVLVYLVWLVRPVYLGQMTGMFSKPIYEKEYFKLAEILEKDLDLSRIFWIPTKAPLGFSSPIHTSVEAARLVQKRPFAVGVKGTYETFNFLREAPFTGELFDVAGIGYIAYPFLDPRRDNMHPDAIRYYYTFLNQLSKLPWVLRADKDSPIPLLKIREHQDRFFITPNLWWVVGSDDIYQEATKSASLKLSRNGLVFTEEYPGLGRKLEEVPEGKIVLNKKGLIDLAASFIRGEDIIFPAGQLDFHPGKSGWWKREAVDLIGWRDFLQTKYGLDNQDFDLGGGWAVSEGNLNIKIQNKKLKSGQVLLARVFESTRSGNLRFFQEDKLIGELSTSKEGSNMKWFEVGLLLSDKPLSIESRGDINIVNALAFIKPQEWQVYKNKADDFYKQGRIVDYKDANVLEDTTEVVYQKINPTKYKVMISSLDRPGFLVFSENFDSLWKMGNRPSTPVYSLLNGFRVEKDGEYIVEYEAQKYVYHGLVISGITLLGLVTMLILPSLKRFWH